MLPRSSYITKLVELALAEDGDSGDVTSRVALPEHHMSSASLIAKEDFVFCSGGIIEEIIRCSGLSVTLNGITSDGARVSTGSELGVLKGRTGDILTLERTVLNFIQRLSGIATNTSTYVAAAGSLTVLDTRKTTPGWRLLEKYAVTIGGAKNHRMHLGDLILIKNNHIDAYDGNLKSLFEKVYSERPAYIPVEVEVRTQQELESVLTHCTPDIIMLDNMNDRDIRASAAYLKTRAPSVKIEISGGMNLERLHALSDLDISVSIGALTTQARSVDISLRIHGNKN